MTFEKNLLLRDRLVRDDQVRVVAVGPERLLDLLIRHADEHRLAVPAVELLSAASCSFSSTTTVTSTYVRLFSRASSSRAFTSACFCVRRADHPC